MLDRRGALPTTVVLPQLAEELAQSAAVGRLPSDSFRSGEAAIAEASGQERSLRQRETRSFLFDQTYIRRSILNLSKYRDSPWQGSIREMVDRRNAARPRA